MDKLSQNELIGLTTIIRDKKKYQSFIGEHNLFRELHQIIHHEQSKNNRYHGEWSEHIRNYVIHQILWRIIPKEERSQYTKDHPLLKKIKELEEENESGDKLYGQLFHQLFSLHQEIHDLKKRISTYESLEIKDYIQKINELEYTITHHKMNFINPLLQLEWINNQQTIPGGLDPNISEVSRQLMLTQGEILIYDLEYRLPHRLGYTNLCNKCDEIYHLNEKYKEKVKELQKENDNLRKDMIRLIKNLS
jgi:hypothetical protein